jgi:putative acyl-CoA dehydrogenase
MRQAVTQAVHHARHRSAFGKRLVEQPLMQNVLADLCVESEAATVSMLRLARCYDESADGEQKAFGRLATAVLKYWVCKRNPMLCAEALECLGGNGYVEESLMPRLYREAPLNSVWEGSGNVICLDVLRAMGRSPESVELFFAEVGRAREPRLDRYVDALRAELTDFEEIEMRARRIVERLGIALQASLLLRHGSPAVAEAFCASRLAGDHGRAFGTLPRGLDFAGIVERAAA